jgi:hypothetical protein
VNIFNPSLFLGNSAIDTSSFHTGDRVLEPEIRNPTPHSPPTLLFIPQPYSAARHTEAATPAAVIKGESARIM